MKMTNTLIVIPAQAETRLSTSTAVQNWALPARE